MKILSRAIAGFAVLGLGACASQWDIDGVAGTPASGDAFTKALQTEYVESARFEKGEVDYDSVAFFTERARMAASGKAMAPQAPSERGVMAKDAVAAHGALTAALATTAPKDAPMPCAKAQVSFEHWVEQLEEGHQADHIAMYKAAYDKAIPLCVAKPMAMKTAKSYVVYFDFGKSALTADAMKVLAQVAKDQGMDKPANIFVTGHTDSAGDGKSNQSLSIKRAEAVAQELGKMGVSAKVLDAKAFGETMLAVKTPDGKPEAKNRRVEITFEK